MRDSLAVLDAALKRWEQELFNQQYAVPDDSLARDRNVLATVRLMISALRGPADTIPASPPPEAVP